MRRVAVEQGLECQLIHPGLPGTYPTFIFGAADSESPAEHEHWVVKFFGSLFEGASAFKVERFMGKFLLSHSFCLRSPAILAEGELNAEWSYLVFEHIPGASLSQVRREISDTDGLQIARQMGQFMKELHDQTSRAQLDGLTDAMSSKWDEYVAFLETQRANCLANHQRWQDLPAQLVRGMADFLPPVEQLVELSAPRHLMHADLTGDHLLGRLLPRSAGSHGEAGRGWESLAVIDWGDCRVGNILYELVALHLDLFEGDKRYLRECLDTYGLPSFYQEDFPRKALATVLLHQFPMPATVYAPHHEAGSLEELAERIFGV